MSQVVESAHSCQSCQQDLYKSEPGSHHVKVGPHNPVHCRPSFCVLYFPALSLSLSASEYFGCDSPDCFRVACFYSLLRSLALRLYLFEF
jgi:hypothetical protein